MLVFDWPRLAGARATRMSDSVLPADTVVAQRLKIVRALGVGGMGAVYEVEHLLTRHRRALKLLHAEVVAVPGIVERFLREASAAGRIGNPHIVETFDAGTTEDGEPYLVMEMLQGAPLSARLQERGRLEPAEVLEIFSQVCDGVQAAHDSGIVHRDLKPENIFLVAGERPFVKLLDFGISKFDPALTGTPQTTVEGSLLGTPYYMPPEQVRGSRDLDASADVYALGVVLYECLVGKRPFDADTLTHLAVLISEGEYVRATELCPELPPQIDAVIEKALAPDRRSRYKSARELGQAIEGALRRAAFTSMRTEYGAPSVMPPPAYSSVPPAYSNAPPAPSVAPAFNPRVPAGTPAPVETTRHATPERSSPRLALGIGFLLVVVAALALAYSTLRTTALTPEPSAKSGPTAVPTEAPASAAARPTVNAELTEPLKPTPSASAPSPSPSPGPLPTAARAPARPSAEPSPGAGSGSRRSTQHGLVEQNPFQ
jgi:serine/threonine protein kinase